MSLPNLSLLRLTRVNASDTAVAPESAEASDSAPQKPVRKLATAAYDKVNVYGNRPIRRYHPATVGTAEMMVAEYCWYTSQTLDFKVKDGEPENSDDESDDDVVVVVDGRKRFKRDDHRQYSRRKTLRRMVENLIKTVKNITVLLGEKSDEDDFTELIARWNRLKTVLPVVLKWKWNPTTAETATAFLHDYLKARGLPEDASASLYSGEDTYVTRIQRYEEYFSVYISRAYYCSNRWTKTICVHPEGVASPLNTVGMIMFSDVPTIYNWTSKGENGEKQWHAEGILACPFFLSVRRQRAGEAGANLERLGVGDAILSHLEGALKAEKEAKANAQADGVKTDEMEIVTSVAIDVASDAPAKWKKKLADTDFIDCPRC